jgi:hypothetical protein
VNGVGKHTRPNRIITALKRAAQGDPALPDTKRALNALRIAANADVAASSQAHQALTELDKDNGT